MFSLINQIISHYYVWFFLLIAFAIGAQASAIPNSEINLNNRDQPINVFSLLNNGMENTSFITYSADRFEVNTFVHSLKYYEEDVYFGLETNCDF